LREALLDHLVYATPDLEATCRDLEIQLGWNRLGWVCLIGSIALLPAAFYNLRSATPWVWISILNVLASVVLMAVTLHFLLRRAGFRWLWTLSWVVLIVINMSLYLSSVL
jgi:hypothetical protein